MASAHTLKVAAKQGDLNLLYTVIHEDPHVLDLMDNTPFAQTPLHVAACAGHLQFATEIMGLKASFALKLNQQGFSPIHLAMQHSQNKMVLRFIEINKDLARVKGRNGVTPLHLASQIGDIDLLVNILLACPDSIKDVTFTRETALHVALRCQKYEALQVLVGWLKRTLQKHAIALEKTILNWKNEDDNTILHISALTDDIEAIQFLVKTKVDLNIKNGGGFTALDIAANNPEIKFVLEKAGAKHGSSIRNAPTFLDKLRSNKTLVDKIVIFILRIRMDTTEEQRNAFLIIAALVATTTYQLALSPAGGVLQANADDNTSDVGTAVMRYEDFILLTYLNALSILVSTMIIFILTPSGTISKVVFGLMFLFVICYLYSMRVISPDTRTRNGIYGLVCIFFFLYLLIFWSWSKIYKKIRNHNKDKEMKGEIE